jgi:hypothetical protein
LGKHELSHRTKVDAALLEQVGRWFGKFAVRRQIIVLVQMNE